MPPIPNVNSQLKQLFALIRQIPHHSREDVGFQNKLHSSADNILTACTTLDEKSQKSIRQLIALFGDAYEYYRLTGDASQLDSFIQRSQSFPAL